MSEYFAGGHLRFVDGEWRDDDGNVIEISTVRHGQWGDYEPYSDGYRCSCCKLVHRTCTTYCPNCGAKMMEG